jgi:hypothetical protein
MADEPGTAGLADRRREYQEALWRYREDPFYTRLGKVVSASVLTGQAGLLLVSLREDLGWLPALLALALAWLAADLLGGVVHLLMDHHDRYTGRLGPLVAAFHLHHQQPRYEEKSLARVYIHESGFKLWLPFFLAAGLGLGLAGWLDGLPLRVWAWTGILSSVAEVSHFLVHARRRPWADWLAAAGLLLSRRHHSRHHREDNVGYAFLNGWSDPLLNAVARRWFPGYRNGTDRHARQDGGTTGMEAEESERSG